MHTEPKRKFVCPAPSSLYNIIMLHIMLQYRTPFSFPSCVKISSLDLYQNSQHQENFHPIHGSLALFARLNIKQQIQNIMKFEKWFLVKQKVLRDIYKHFGANGSLTKITVIINLVNQIAVNLMFSFSGYPYTTEDVIDKKQCPVCMKFFTRRTSLSRHMLIHTGEKPFECRVCGKRFNQKSARKGHMLRHYQT